MPHFVLEILKFLEKSEYLNKKDFLNNILQNGTLQCPGEGFVCHRDSEPQTGKVLANPGRVVSLIIKL
jgi:hypothetical protein